MENKLSKTQQTSLVNITSDSVIKEQNTKDVKRNIALLLQRLSKLYQVPNWTEENAILLTEWIYENYQYETFDTIYEVLINPPKTGNKNWRLTPDTIQEWMSIQLDKEAEKREQKVLELKHKEAEPISEQTTVNFAEIFKDSWYEKALNEQKRSIAGYNKFREQFYAKNQPRRDGDEPTKD